MAIVKDPASGVYYSTDERDPPFDPHTGQVLGPPNTPEFDNGGTGPYPNIQPGTANTSTTTTTTTPPQGEDFNAFLTGLQNQYNVPWTANDSPTDLARLKEYEAGVARFRALQADPNTDWAAESAKGAISTPEQLADFKRRLAAQYEQRGKNTNGPDDGTSSSGYVPPNSGGGGGGGGGGNTGGGNYAMSFGKPPAPFSETYTTLARPDYLQGEYKAPARPDYLQGPYTPPVWDERFTAPSVADLQNDPGYLARMDAAQRGFERSAAAKGSVLSGGFVGRTLPRELQTQASNEYANVYNRAYTTYLDRYGQFKDMATNLGNARVQNENAYNSDVTNAYNTRNVNENMYGTDVSNQLNAYNKRYQAYQDLMTNTRNAENDWWGRQTDIAKYGLDASIAGRPTALS
jgi:hypothetical protein